MAKELPPSKFGVGHTYGEPQQAPRRQHAVPPVPPVSPRRQYAVRPPFPATPTPTPTPPSIPPPQWQPAPHPSQPVPATPPRSKTWGWLLGAAVAVLILAIAGLVIVRVTDSSESTPSADDGQPFTLPETPCPRQCMTNNFIAVDRDGMIYLTRSNEPQFYRLAPGAAQWETVQVQRLDELSGGITIGIDGTVYLLGRSEGDTSAQLLSIDPQTQREDTVSLEEVESAGGLTITDGGDLYFVGNVPGQGQAIYLLAAGSDEVEKRLDVGDQSFFMVDSAQAIYVRDGVQDSTVSRYPAGSSSAEEIEVPAGEHLYTYMAMGSADQPFVCVQDDQGEMEPEIYRLGSEDALGTAGGESCAFFAVTRAGDVITADVRMNLVLTPGLVP